MYGVFRFSVDLGVLEKKKQKIQTGFNLTEIIAYNLLIYAYL